MTVSFIIGAAAIGAALDVVSAYWPAGSSYVWSAHGLPLLGCAALTGLFVDLLRLISRHSWPQKLPFKLRLNKVLNQHLA